MNNLIQGTLVSELTELERQSLRLDLNDGTYEQIEHLMISKLIKNLSIKQLYLECAKEYLYSKNNCVNCKFYKSDIRACTHPKMEQEYYTPFYVPDNINFSCDLITYLPGVTNG